MQGTSIRRTIYLVAVQEGDPPFDLLQGISIRRTMSYIVAAVQEGDRYW